MKRKQFRVRFWHQDGGEDFMEFDTMEQAEKFYRLMDGKAEIQEWKPEVRDYEAKVYPEFEV